MKNKSRSQRRRHKLQNNNAGITRRRHINCSPGIEGQRATSNTCMPLSLLHRIRDDYNRKHRGNSPPIHETKANELFAALQTRFMTCPDERCWIDRIFTDDNVRGKIKNTLFAPLQPLTWQKNQVEWLSNEELRLVLNQYEKRYPNFSLLGSTYMNFTKVINNQCLGDELCNFSLEKQVVNRGKTKLAMIINLAYYPNKGTHWVSMFIDVDEKFIFFFDSNGAPIPKDMAKFRDVVIAQGKNMSPPIHFHFYQNYPKIHQSSNTECGMYALFFVITLLTNAVESPPNADGSPGKSRKLTTVAKKVKFFRTNRIPDRYVQQFRNIYFNKPSH